MRFMSIREEMLTRLAQAGVDACLPGQKEGLCKKPYVVVSDAGTYATGRTTGYKVFLVTGYVPAARPLDLRELLIDAQTALVGMKSIRTTGEISPESIDDDRKAHIATVEYTALCAR